MIVRNALIVNRILFIASLILLVLTFTLDGAGLNGWIVLAAMLVTLITVVVNAVDFFYHVSQRKGIPTMSIVFVGLSVLVVGYLFYCVWDFFIANPPSDF